MIKKFEEFFSKVEESSLFESSTKARIEEIPYISSEWDDSTRKIKKTSGSTKILDITGRKVILIDINGISCPFYLSSGGGGKKNVPAGKWYPFFGIGFDGWFNKSNEEEILKYYDAPILKFYAEYLDKTIGDVRDKDTPKAASLAFGSEKEAAEAMRNGSYPVHVKTINKDLVPTDNESSDTLVKFRNNLEQFKSKLKKAISVNESRDFESSEIDAREDVSKRNDLLVNTEVDPGHEFHPTISVYFPKDLFMYIDLEKIKVEDYSKLSVKTAEEIGSIVQDLDRSLDYELRRCLENMQAKLIEAEKKIYKLPGVTAAKYGL